MPQKLLEVKKQFECLQRFLDSIECDFFDPANLEEFRDELDSACIALDDAIAILERDSAYRQAVGLQERQGIGSLWDFLLPRP
jgi:hypothetical protein